MPTALLVTKASEAADSIALVLRECGAEDISVSDGEHTRAALSDSAYDLVIVNTPLESEYGLGLAAEISRSHSCAVMVLIKSENIEEASKKLEGRDIFLVPKNVGKAMLVQSAKYAIAMHNALKKQTEAADALRQKLDDIKLIDRAKCVLIEYLRISESQAHRQIQKQAMDQRLSQVAVAMNILKTYEQ